MDQVAKRYLLDFQFGFSFGVLTTRHAPNEDGNVMTTLLLYGVTAVFVPNPKGVFMKRSHLIPLSLVVSALASGTILADEHSQSKIDSLESRLNALQKQVDDNNLDSVS